MSRTARVVTLLSLVLTSLMSPAGAEDWPRFRGPNGQGVSSEEGLPVKWSATENVAWKVPTPGEGWSSPVIAGGRVYLTAARDRGVACHVVCLDAADGKVLWDTKVFDQETRRKEGKNSYATPTPVVDGRAVYAVFGGGGIAAVDLAGKILWTNRDHRFYSRHGLGSSPIVHGGLLIQAFDGSIEPGPGVDAFIGWQKPWDRAYLLALDAATGKERWRGKRGLSRISHMTPIVARVGDKDQVISPAGDVVQGFDPATGELIWTVRNGGEGTTPSPVLAAPDLLILASGFPTNVPGGAAVRGVRLDPAARGDVTTTHLAWEQKDVVPNIPSFVCAGPHAYGVRENGMAICLEAKTGKLVWRQRLPGNYSASPVYADGRIYFLSESGATTVIEPGTTYKEVARNDLGDGEGPVQASMAVSGGRLFIRTAKHVWCIGR